jgi:hypothetical protein
LTKRLIHNNAEALGELTFFCYFAIAFLRSRAMNGIHVINDPSGKPAVLAIDLNHLDPAISQMVEGLLNTIQRSEEETDQNYDDNEYQYTDAHLIERNPNYRPK